ncbi:alpha/beta hydrolase [Maledivibacter halophilus]|uniref:Pimeloyl-ACP methyl ester carboxylesterase n=1 Tax=Maledivibacter halophilus TaxID=36842 RepID=A0A1T5LN57_9FIRM|nr:alpha/beta hydrolase [Maledivibacter halophilus]SKC76959.1 Pimeloyl-ACP methyl ester carboxylesterase [Maledivibacter halophilus]
MNFEMEFERFNREYPLKSKKIGELTFHYRLGGKGKEVLILLVGGLGISDAFYNHFKEFAKYYTVLTFDYPIESDRNSVLSDGIAALVKSLGLGKAFLVGQSYGGLIAQIIAKRHPEIMKGLILSNTGCLDEGMDEGAKQLMMNRMKGLRKTILLTRFIPMSLFKGVFLKRMEKHFEQCTPDEKQYLLDLSRSMFSKLSNRHERHMCSLMADLINEMNITRSDLAYLDKKVILLLSEDDHTFGDAVNRALIEMMPNPVICTDINGGHLALLLKIDLYIKTVCGFIDSFTICNQE